MQRTELTVSEHTPWGTKETRVLVAGSFVVLLAEILDNPKFRTLAEQLDVFCRVRAAESKRLQIDPAPPAATPD